MFRDGQFTPVRQTIKRTYHPVMAYEYARETFWQAVDTLATSDASIQGRLAGAAVYLVRVHRQDEELPEEVREEFKALMHDLTKEASVAKEGTINATTAKLTAEGG